MPLRRRTVQQEVDDHAPDRLWQYKKDLIRFVWNENCPCALVYKSLYTYLLFSVKQQREMTKFYIVYKT